MYNLLNFFRSFSWGMGGGDLVELGSVDFQIVRTNITYASSNFTFGVRRVVLTVYSTQQTNKKVTN